MDNERWHYWLVALIATAVWIVTLLRERPAGTPGVAWRAWSLASVGLLLAWRWPYLVGPAILNPDEAQMIAGAITLKSYPLFWKYVDGTTHGPLADWPLVVLNWFGLPLSYGGARFAGGMMVLGGFILAGRGLMRFYSPSAVKLGLAPVMLLWASIAFYDFAGYTSEHAAIFLILASVWPFTTGLGSTGRSPWQRASFLFLGAFLLGCIPYAKLQGVPVGMTIGIIAAVAAFRDRDRFRLLGTLAAGAMLPSLMLLVYLLIWGLLNQFWTFYILNNLLYAGAGDYTLSRAMVHLWEFMHMAPGLQTVCVQVILLGVFAGGLVLRSARNARPWSWTRTSAGSGLLRLLRVLRQVSPSGRLLAKISIAVLVVSIYATIAPRHAFSHYLQFLGFPLGLLGVIACGEAWEHIRRWNRAARFTATTLLVTGLTVPLIVARATRSDPDMRGEWTRRGGEIRHPVSIAITKLAQPGDTMSVWGWMPKFYVETGLPHATREAHTQRQIQGKMVPVYRQRYIRDLTRRRPRIFIDAVGGDNFSYNARSPEHRHENFPELRDIIARDYRLAEEVDGSRIYLRK